MGGKARADVAHLVCDAAVTGPALEHVDDVRARGVADHVELVHQAVPGKEQGLQFVRGPRFLVVRFDHADDVESDLDIAVGQVPVHVHEVEVDQGLHRGPRAQVILGGAGVGREDVDSGRRGLGVRHEERVRRGGPGRSGRGRPRSRQVRRSGRRPRRAGQVGGVDRSSAARKQVRRRLTDRHVAGGAPLNHVDAFRRLHGTHDLVAVHHQGRHAEAQTLEVPGERVAG